MKQKKTGMILNQMQPTLTFAAKLAANEMWCLKAMWRPALTGHTSIFDLKIFFKQFAFVNSPLLYD